MGSSTEELVLKAVAGEPLAVERLLLEFYPRLAARVERRLPRLLRATHSADDIVQETFAEAFRTISDFCPRGEGSFFAWLSTTADNRIIDATRAQRAAKRGGGRAPIAGSPSSVAALVDVLRVSQGTPSRAARRNEVAGAVHVALAGLKEEYREAIGLRYLAALPVAEVAARMGKTESSVHKLCSRGLQELRESMGEAAKYLSRA
jgi:RNA polymerase sigma-70 factor, ECF subfamily